MVHAERDVHQHHDGSDKRNRQHENASSTMLREESHQEGLGASRHQESAAASSAMAEKGVIGSLSLHDSNSPPQSKYEPGQSHASGKAGSDAAAAAQPSAKAGSDAAAAAAAASQPSSKAGADAAAASQSSAKAGADGPSQPSSKAGADAAAAAQPSSKAGADAAAASQSSSKGGSDASGPSQNSGKAGSDAYGPSHDSAKPTENQHKSPSASDARDNQDRPAAAEKPPSADKKNSDAGALPGIKVENHGASDKFVQDAQHVMEAALSRLTPEAQKSMAGLSVSIQKHESRDVQPGTPGAYQEKGDTLHLFQRPSEQMRAQNRKPEEIVAHELGHPLDVHNGHFSRSPEFKQEFDKAVKSLPPNLRKQIDAGIRALGPEQARAEVFADLAAISYGANPNTLGYLPPDFVPAFKGAQELIHKRFFK